MKNTWIIILLFLNSITLFGQNPARYYLSYRPTGIDRTLTCMGGQSAGALFVFNSGLRLEYFEQTNGNLNKHSQLEFSINENSNSFSVIGEYLITEYNGWFGAKSCDCCGQRMGDSRSYKTDLLNRYKTTSYSTFTYGIPNWDGNIAVTFWPANLNMHNTDDEIILENDPISLSATAGFPADAYRWMYTVPDDPRFQTQFFGMQFPINKDLTKLNGINAGTVTGAELLGPIFQEIAASGKKILLYLVSRDENGNDVFYTKILIPKLYSPKILSAIAQTAKCSDSKTSSVVIKFDRPIGAGKTLELGNYINTVGGTFKITDDSLNSNLEYELKNLAVNKTYTINVRNYYLQDGTNLKVTHYVNPVAFSYSLTAFPKLLETKLQSNGVYCYGGKDGTMYGQVKGGTSPFTLSYNTKNPGTALSISHSQNSNNVTQWANDVSVITSLQAGTYKLISTDKNGCVAMDSITLNQPTSPLTITSRTSTEVSGYGLSNGSYQIKLKGGTTTYPAPTLKSSTGILYTALLTGSANNEYSYSFNNLPAGGYNLRAIDNALAMNGVSIKDFAGCLVKEMLTILQPPPLTSVIEQTTILKCAGDKTATLIAHAKGGKPFSIGRPYNYQWSFSQNGILAYASLSNQDSIFTLRGAGFYKLLLTDQNNNQVTTVFQLSQPDFINADLLVKNVTCLNWTDGEIKVSNIRGGTGLLTLQWLDGQTQASRTNLAAGSYPFTITDAKGCIVSIMPIIKDTLNGITITANSSVLPICYGEPTGALSATVQVETPPYSILWNNGATTSSLENIAAGTYTVRVTNSKNCIKEATFILANPPSIAMDLDTLKYLCNGQVATYDLAKPGYQYAWSGPNFTSTSGNVNLTTEGTYAVSVEDTKGCKASNTITIHRIHASVGANFVVPSQVFAGQEVSLVNITNPSMQDSAYWVFDTTDIDILHMDDAYGTLVFKKEGVYKIALHTKQDNCTAQLEKEVIVKDASFAPQAYTGSTSFIKEFEIRPNPSDGNFEVMIKLKDIASVKLTLVDVYSKGELASLEETNQKEYLIPMHVQVAAGTYMLFMETPYGVRVIKVIII